MNSRLKSAIILIPIIILFIYLAPPILWLALTLILGFLAMSEYYALTLVETTSKDRSFGYMLNAVSIIIVYLTESVSFAAFLAFLALAFHHIIKLEDHDDLVNYFLRDLLGMFYCAIMPSYILLIRLLDGSSYIYLLLITIWAIDTSAYYVGSSIGKIKLIPEISPKKTVEGAIGGTVGAIIVLITARALYFKNFSLSDAIIFGLALSFSAQIGDLFESLLKRARGVKDSGDLIPGHGGILDRLDSLLFAAPAFFYFTLFLNL
jgi:phosphatidate cytidylyltransferase